MTQRQRSNLGVLCIATLPSNAALVRTAFSAGDRVTVFPSAADAARALEATPRLAFNVDLLVADDEDVHVEPLLPFLPFAVRALVGDDPEGPTPLPFDKMIEAASLDAHSFDWLRARARISSAHRAPSAQLYVHLETRAIVVANDAALELLGARDFEGGLLGDLLALPDEAFTQNAWRGRVELSEGAILGITSRRLAGPGLFVALSDITEVMATRDHNRREENLMLLGKAAAVLAHEISNPLAAIKANLQLVSAERERLSQDALSEYLTRSLAEVSRLSGIVSNYLSLVREHRPAAENAALADLLNAAGQQVGDMLRTVKVSWVLEPFDEDLWVQFGSSQFHQVVWNLAKNSVDSMLRAGVERPSFRIHLVSADERFVEIGFDDNGGGLPPGHEDRLFDAFVTTKGSGTGLGLMVCRLLARRFGGDIEMVRLDEGARALLRMRRATAETGMNPCPIPPR